jgi:hypothetical protein
MSRAVATLAADRDEFSPIFGRRRGDGGRPAQSFDEELLVATRMHGTVAQRASHAAQGMGWAPGRRLPLAEALES